MISIHLDPVAYNTTRRQSNTSENRRYTECFMCAYKNNEKKKKKKQNLYKLFGHETRIAKQQQ